MDTRSRGFTLIELMVTVAVAAILATIAMPNFRDFMRRNNVVAQANSLLADLQYARGEAVAERLGTNGQPLPYVSICPRATSAAAGDTQCASGGSANFDSGWLVYVASVQNAAYDGSTELLRVTQIPSSVSIRASSASILSFNRRGELVSNSDASTSLVICSRASSGGEDTVGENTTSVPGKRLTLSASGHASLSSLGAGEACQ